MDLDLKTKNTWCPGCGNFGILAALKRAIALLEKEGMEKESFVLVAGIGCHAKIADYVNLNSFYGLHGRTIPVATGIKIANPNLNVFCMSGDGDSYNEGMEHLIHAAKRNTNITVVIHDNRNFALTVKQFTATSPKGFSSNSSPYGNIEKPINPLELMLSAGATFVARGYSVRIEHLANIIKEGIKHKGFSFIEVLQNCVTWFDETEKYNKGVYEFTNPLLSSKEEALKEMRKWNYEDGGSIPIGVFYQILSPCFEEEILKGIENKKSFDVSKVLALK